jgi:hypothetical protein
LRDAPLTPDDAAVRAPSDRRLSRTRKIAFALLAPALGWLVLEGLCALILATLPPPPPPPDRPDENPDWQIQIGSALDHGFFLLDSDVIWTLRPGYFRPANLNRWWGDEPLSLNEHGHRNPSMPEAKPEDVRRVMVLGGSHPFGMWVAGSKSYSAVLERLLNAGGERWQVLNAASPGHTSFQGRAYLETYGLAFEPDVVVFDLGNNDELELTASWAAADHEVQAVPIWARGVAGQASRSRVYRLAARLLDPARRTSSEHRVRVPPEQRRGNMQAVAELAQRQGFEVLWMSQVEVNDDPAVVCPMPFEQWEPRVDVCGVFAPYGPRAIDYFVDRIHANTEGHAMIAEAIHARMVELGWTDGHSPEG